LALPANLTASGRVGHTTRIRAAEYFIFSRVMVSPPASCKIVARKAAIRNGVLIPKRANVASPFTSAAT
jgi:hypothetical protein